MANKTRQKKQTHRQDDPQAQVRQVPQVHVTQVPHMFNAEVLAWFQRIDQKLGEIVALLKDD